MVKGLKLSPEFMSNSNEIAVGLVMLLDRLSKADAQAPHAGLLRKEILRCQRKGLDSIPIADINRILESEETRRQHEGDAIFLMKLVSDLRLGEVTITKTMREMMAAEEVHGMVEALVAIVQDELSGDEFEEVRLRIASRFENLCNK
jgi:DNA-binding transcriptional MerR regulator